MATKPVEFTGESGATYALDCFGTNAACRVEAALGKHTPNADGRPWSYEDAMAELRGPSPRVSVARAWFLGSLISPDPKTQTLDQVGDAIDDLGGWMAILFALDSRASLVTKAIAEQMVAIEEARAASQQDPVTH